MKKLLAFESRHLNIPKYSLIQEGQYGKDTG
jgi:hypothetical protein